MPARQHDDLVIQIVLREFPDHLLGKLRQKCHVVLRIDNQRASRPARELIEIHHRTDGSPYLPQILQIDSRLQSLADVARRLPMPNHIGKVSRSGFERRYLTPSSVRCGNKRIARPKASPDDSEPVVTLRLQPIE